MQEMGNIRFESFIIFLLYRKEGINSIVCENYKDLSFINNLCNALT
jgi:hypothetical protein